jgi:hypothetical protein
MSTRQQAEVLGVDQKTVVNDQHAEEKSSPAPEEPTKDGAEDEHAEEKSSPDSAANGSANETAESDPPDPEDSGHI